MNKKLIYIFERRHYYNFDNTNFGINYFLKQGYEVEVWSAVEWTFNCRIATPVNLDTSGRGIYLKGESDFFNECKRIKNDNCVFLIYPYHAYNKISYIIRKTLKKYHFPFCNLTEAIAPIDWKLSEPDYNFLNINLYYVKLFLLKIKTLFTVKKQSDNVEYAFPNEKANISPACSFWGPVLYKSNYNFIVAHKNWNGFTNKYELLSNRNIFIAHNDYDLYLSSKEKYININSRYVVFIDEYECGHSDWLLTGRDLPITDSELYYQELCSMMEYVERNNNCEVIIAAHPKAEYKGNEFGGRKIIYNETAGLIMNSLFVLYMHGTSLDFILLSHKPFIQICTSQHLKGHRTDYYIYDIIEKFGNKILSYCDIKNNIDLNLEDYLYYDKNKYNYFIDNFILSKKGDNDYSYKTINKYVSKLY